ncbi:hypothetical protein GOP47_0002258 [Adiantum capillus-veneris]|uniref:Uncharacterized protein n=1 Tax=Adiantum capillus-veneris TaxID=13818 RepID=A0A9D4V9T9_ADICA|nr:hypothetical protein GOP47_0002258 [Adiantum capillus-veneris]
MDPYSFLRSLDERPPFLGALNGLNPLSSLNGLNVDLSAPVDVRGKGRVAREEAALQAILVKKITDGDWDSLKPNTGKAVNVEDHHICVAYHEDAESGCRVWEWHGHLLIFDDDVGFTPEYTYGNFFQPLEAKKSHSLFDEEDDDDCKPKNGDKVTLSIGLGGIIDNSSKQSLSKNKQQNGHILHRVVKKDASELTKK